MIIMMVMMTMMLPKAMASDDDDNNDYDDEGDDDDYEDEGDGIDHHHGHVHVGKSFPTWTQISDVDMSVSEATFRHGRNFPTWTSPCRKKLSDVDRSLICRRGQMSASDRILSVSEELKFTYLIVSGCCQGFESSSEPHHLKLKSSKASQQFIPCIFGIPP